MARKAGVVVLTAAFALLAIPASAGASTIPVDTLADGPAADGHCSLRSAIQASFTNSPVGASTCPPGTVDFDTITFTVNGTIELQAPLPDLPNFAKIDGPGADKLTVKRMPGAPAFGIFDVGTSFSFEIEGLTISNGLTTDGSCGAGVHTEGSNTVLTNVVVTDNHVLASDDQLFGGGVCNDGGSLSIDGSTISDNSVTAVQASGDIAALGGGVANISGGLTITTTTISDNSATASGSSAGHFIVAIGGAISNGNLNGDAVGLSVAASTISGNQAEGIGPASAAVGGGVANSGDGASASLELTTITGNGAASTGSDSEGGGVAQGQTGSGDMLLTSDTIAANAAQSGSNIYVDVAPVTEPTVTNTIVADGISSDSCHGGVDSEDYNIEDGSSCALGETHDRSLIVADLLYPLRDNGGPVRTLALPPGSPAVDSGQALDETLDARGLPRPVDLFDRPNLLSSVGTDVGAYELQDTTPPVLTLSKRPAKRTKSRKATFKFSSNEPGTTFTCKLDKRPVRPCTSPTTYKKLSPGHHVLVIVAVDVWGNAVADPPKVGWNIKKNVKV